MPKKSGQQQLPLGWACDILIDFSCQDSPKKAEMWNPTAPFSVSVFLSEALEDRKSDWIRLWISPGVLCAKVAVTAASQMLGHALHVHASGPAGPIKSHTLGMGFMKGCCLKNHRRFRSLATRNEIEMYLSSVCLYSLYSLYRHMATHGDTWRHMAIMTLCPKFSSDHPQRLHEGRPQLLSHRHPPVRTWHTEIHWKDEATSPTCGAIRKSMLILVTCSFPTCLGNHPLVDLNGTSDLYIGSEEFDCEFGIQVTYRGRTVYMTGTIRVLNAIDEFQNYSRGICW